MYTHTHVHSYTVFVYLLIYVLLFHTYIHTFALHTYTASMYVCVRVRRRYWSEQDAYDSAFGCQPNRTLAPEPSVVRYLPSGYISSAANGK